MPEGVQRDKDAISETIANNVRSKIIKEHLNDPAYYEKMSRLLDEILKELKEKRLEYQEYLNKVAELAKQVQRGHAETLPEALNTPGRRALYNNLAEDEKLAMRVDEAVKQARPDGWRGVHAREQVVKRAMYGVLQDVEQVEKLFPIIKQQQEY